MRPKIVKSVHYCPATMKTMERTYTDLTSLDAYPSTAVYPTQVSLTRGRGGGDIGPESGRKMKDARKMHITLFLSLVLKDSGTRTIPCMQTTETVLLKILFLL